MSKNNRRTHARRAQGHPSSLFPGEPAPDSTHNRSHRLEQLLLDELQSIVRDQASDPSLAGIGLLQVTLSPDAAHARIGYVVAGSLEEERALAARTQAALERATGFVRARLAAGLDLKKLPRLTFTFVGVVAAGGAQ
jgi:ribosome-binding factor A